MLGLFNITFENGELELLFYFLNEEGGSFNVSYYARLYGPSVFTLNTPNKRLNEIEGSMRCNG